jgi:hypothetical protein
MPEITFFFSESELEQLVATILDKGCRFVPTNTTGGPAYEQLADTSSIATARTRERLFHIIHPSYQVCPLRLSPVQRPGEPTRYYVVQKEGGPTINLFFGGTIAENAQVRITDNFLSYHSSFWNFNTGRNEKPTRALIDYYKHFARFIKSNSKILRDKKRTYYASDAARRLIAEGVTVRGLEHLAAIARDSSQGVRNHAVLRGDVRTGAVPGGIAAAAE